SAHLSSKQRSRTALERLAHQFRNSFGEIVGDAQVFAEETNSAGDLLVHERMPVGSRNRCGNIHLRSAEYGGEFALGLTTFLEALHLGMERDQVRDAVRCVIAGAV